MTRLEQLIVRHRRRQSDAGFTMLELLIVIVVLPLLIGALATLIITLLQNTVPNDPHGTATRLADSHDAQLTSVYFSRDIQSAAEVSSDPAPLCASAGAGSNQILGLQWTSGGQTVDVSYFVQQSPLELVRYYCTSNSPPGSYPVTATSTSLISDNIFSTTTSATVGSCPGSGFGTGADTCAVKGTTAYLALTVTCSPGACPAGLAHNPGMAVNATPNSVATVLIQAQESLSAYRYSLTASPRTSNPALPAPLNAGIFPPFIANGSVSGGNCAIATDGIMAVNSAANPSISTGPQGMISATGGVVTPGTTAAGSNVSPPPVFGFPQASPYFHQTEPPNDPAGVVEVTETAPFDPSTDPNVVNSRGVLDPTKYPHGAIFIVTSGMTVSKNISAPQGVLFYVTGGNVNLHGQGTIALNPLVSPTYNFESPTQPSPEIVLWISSSDTSPNPPTLTLDGNGRTTAINGAVYAPTTAVTMNGGGNGGGVVVSAFDIGSLNSCNGGGNVIDNIAVGFPGSATTVSPSTQNVTLGSSVTAIATVEGLNPPTGNPTPSGTVTFYECGPPAMSCDNTGTQVGIPVPVSGAGTTVTATSLPFVPASEGSYCFAAYYSGGSGYPSSSDTSSDGCFNVTSVVPAPVILLPTPNACYNGTGGCSTAYPGISGTATDTVPPGLQKVQVAIADSSGKYWNGTSFVASATPIWIDSTTFTPAGVGAWTWSYTSPITFESGGHQPITYTASARSIDTNSAQSPTSQVSFQVKA